MQVAHATPTTSCPFQRFHSEWSYECTGTFVHKSLSFRKTTFSTSLTNLTAFPSQSHKWQLLRKQTYTGTSTMIYANTASCTLPSCDIRQSSLTLPAPKAWRFVELLLLYSQQSTCFWKRYNAAWPFRVEPSGDHVTPPAVKYSVRNLASKLCCSYKGSSNTCI